MVLGEGDAVLRTERLRENKGVDIDSAKGTVFVLAFFMPATPGREGGREGERERERGREGGKERGRGRERGREGRTEGRREREGEGEREGGREGEKERGRGRGREGGREEMAKQLNNLSDLRVQVFARGLHVCGTLHPAHTSCFLN